MTLDIFIMHHNIRSQNQHNNNYITNIEEWHLLHYHRNDDTAHYLGLLSFIETEQNNQNTYIWLGQFGFSSCLPCYQMPIDYYRLAWYAWLTLLLFTIFSTTLIGNIKEYLKKRLRRIMCIPIYHWTRLRILTSLSW